MALKLNPVTGQMEEDGTALAEEQARLAAAEQFKREALSESLARKGAEAAAAEEARLAAAAAPVPTAVQPQVQAPDDPLKALRDQQADSAARQQNAAAIALATSGGKQVTTQRRESKVVQTEDEKKAVSALSSAQDKTAAAAAEVSRIAAQKAEAEAREDAAKVAAIEAEQARAAKVLADRRAKYDAGVNLLEQKQAALANHKITDFFADKSEATRVTAALLVGLGQFGASLSGGENGALKIIDSAIARDRQLKLDQFAKSKAMVELQANNVDMYKQNLEMADIEIKNQHVALLNKLDAQRKASLASFGKSEEEAKGGVISAGLEERKQQALIEIQKGLRTTIDKSRSETFDSNANKKAVLQAMMAKVNGTDIPRDKASPTQEKSDGYTQRAVLGLKQLKTLKDYSEKDLDAIERHEGELANRLVGADPTAVGRIVMSMRGSMQSQLSAAGKARWNAEDEVIVGVLRPDSGAAIGADEAMSAGRGVRTQKGETAESRAQKDARMIARVGSIASQSYRPEYWLRELDSATSNRPKISREDMAGAMDFIKKNQNSSDPDVRAKVNETIKALRETN